MRYKQFIVSTLCLGAFAVCTVFWGESSVRGQNTSPLDTAPGATSSAPGTAAPAPTGNLIPNGDFALATQDPAWPDGWSKPKGPGTTWESDGGVHFLRLVAQEPGKMLMLYREVGTPAGVKNLQVTFKYRTSGIVAGAQNWMNARAMFHFLDANRKTVAPDPHVLVFSGPPVTWAEATETCAVPAGATTLVLMPSLFKVQAGTLDLAEIKVVPVP